MDADTPLTDIRIGEISFRWARSSQIASRYEKSTGSTNDLAKEEAFGAAAEETVKAYFTDHQTKGRGRNSSTWVHDLPGSALISSWSFALQDPPQPALTAKLGLALARAAVATWGFLPWSLKLPNDLYLGDKKISGLLVETLSQGPDVRVIVGLGLNVWAAPESVGTSVALTQGLPPGAPLTGQDWIAFLERWMFEMSGAVAAAGEPLTETERFAIKDLINRRPGQAPVTDVLEDGSWR